jgi:hypothetical protein
MDAELEAIKEAVIAQDYDQARQLSDAYVEANSDVFVEFADLSIEECVQAVSIFRNANMSARHWQVEAWLLYHFDPQNIGGVAKATIRKSGAA